MTRLDDAPGIHLVRCGRWLHAGGLGIAAALFAAVYVPASAALNSAGRGINAEIDAAVRLLESADELRAEHARLEALQGRTEARAEQLLARIPDAPQESEFLAHIARLAARTGLAIRDFRPAATTKHRQYSQVEVRLSATGRYEAICSFLDGLESLPRLCRVTRLSILAGNPLAGNPADAYSVEITFHIYFAPQRPAAGTAGTSAAGGTP